MGSRSLLAATVSRSLLLVFLSASAIAAPTVDIWQASPDGRAFQKGSDGGQVPVAVYAFSPLALESVLRAAPLVDAGFEGAIRFPLPTPDGERVDFLLVERPTLSSDLRLSRPHLRTYAGVREDDPRSELRLTCAPGIVIGSVLGPDGWNLDSTVAEFSGTIHMWRNSDDPSSAISRCDTSEDAMTDLVPKRRIDAATHGELLRTYEFAMTGTGEFTVFHGSVALAEAQIAALVNLANAVLERELAVRLQLVDINVYPDPATDPFTDGLTPNELSLDENQTALDRRLGANNYELGHVVSRLGSAGWRGLAQPGAQCNRFGKARGATYAAAPYAGSLVEGILHECGHQLGALHSFNGTAGSCGANRAPSWAYEIASGVTLMSYAGICGSENVINTERIPVYNAGSLEAIISHMAFTSDCGTVQQTGNSLPVADAGPDYTIPRQTAFVLDGSSSSDLDPDDLSFSWEQYDLGPPSPPYGPAQGPLFRNFAPGNDPLRSIPTYSYYRAGIQAPYEFLPTVDRTLTFRLVVRDNRPGGAGVGWDTTVLTAVGSPFRFLSPNGGESFESGSEVQVSWQVGGGSVADSVRILFSSDRGSTWSTLESSSPNDGDHALRIPCEVTAGGRLRLEPTDNIFFDISDADFAITPDATAPEIVCPPPLTVQATGSEGIDRGDPALATWIASVEAVDVCDPDPNLTFLAAQTIPVGTTTVAFMAADAASNLSLCTTELTVTNATSSPAGSVRTALLGIQPNPMNPVAVISFQLATPQPTRLTIHDMRGRLVAIAHDGSLPAGAHAVQWDGSGFPSGAYVARLVTAEGVFTHRLALIK